MWLSNRTKLTTQFKRDPLGRLAQQLAVLESSHTPLVQRSYGYDLVGNLIQTQDKRFGTTNYRYDKLGQIQLAGQELFQFDPAHNIIERESERIQNNQVTAYQGYHYSYDEFGNLKERTFPNGEVQRYEYNSKDQLIKAIIQKPNQAIERWQYQYDVLGRRISKRLENQDNLQEFIWDGSHLVQEIDHKTNRTYCYIYTHPSSYEPLAQLHFAKNSKNPTACYYYHNDQIGVPRELTDEDGKLCWYANYSGWGKIKEEYDLTEDKSIHQPFRLQNQYCDSETGLYYNFFRYYEPNIGRFTQLDPIGLAGGDNLYRFADNIQQWIDPLGNIAFLWGIVIGAISGATIDVGMQVKDNHDNGRPLNCINKKSAVTSAALGAVIPPAYKVTKCAASAVKNTGSLVKNTGRAAELEMTYANLYGKDNLGAARRKVGSQLNRVNKEIQINKSNIKDNVIIGGTVYGTSTVIKKTVGGEREIILGDYFGYGDCD